MSWREILRYWRAVEYLEPQKVKNNSIQIIDNEHDTIEWAALAADAFQKWQRGKNSSVADADIADRYEVRFHIWVGIYNVADVIQEMEQRLRVAGEEGGRELSQDQTCLAVFWVDRCGRAIADSFAVSSMPWAMGCLSKGPRGLSNWADHFEKWDRDMREWFAVWVNRHAEKPLTALDLVDIHREILDRAGWQTQGYSHIAGIDVEVLSRAWRHDAEVEHDLLNSFVVKDLGRVAQAIDQGTAGQGVRLYLGDAIITNRVDLMENREEQRSLMHPSRIPLGRWPTGSEKPLVFGQQLAVNLLMSTKPAVFSVNGPPGTGKTTLLRDIIAALVVERAAAMVRYESPKDAFSRYETEKEKGRSRNERPMWKVAEDLSGWEIVVAAATNNAAENITQEIGAMNAIGEEWHQRADYFKDLATSVMGKPAWGLVAAVLGNSKNRSNFVGSFWFGSSSSEKEKGQASSMKSILCSAPAPQEAAKEWIDAREQFAECMKNVQELQAQYASWADASEAHQTILKTVQNRVAELQMAKEQATQAQGQLEEARRAVEVAASRFEEARACLRLVKDWRAWIQVVFRPSEWRKKGAEYKQTRQTFDKAKRERLSAQEALTVLEKVVNERKRQVKEEEMVLHRTIEEKALLDAELEAATQELGDRFPSIDLWDASRDRDRQLSSPWLSDTLNRRRSELFLAALKVHEAFIKASAQPVQANLSRFVDLLSGKDIRIPNEIIPHLWRTLFLVVPVVSTTFASVGRLFKDLGSEALGWTLIDEAGQARPQDPVGLVWRSKRVVFVGDPMQLKPVVTLLAQASSALREAFGAGSEWDVTKTSAQVLADSANAWGTRVHDRWIGSPLWVHRRCLDPMFTVSNQIAYAGQMIQATPVPKEKTLHKPSCWSVVSSDGAEGHWIPAQGDRVIEILRQLVEEFGFPPDAFVLSPFREVSNEVKDLLKKKYGLWAGPHVNRKEVLKWLGTRVGTVHVSQGKEAHTVILLLGGNPRHPGAFRWAASEPNLLNVAVTRAKQRIYVVGDPEKWKHLPYFSVLWRALNS